jgi:hypothetical protein
MHYEIRQPVRLCTRALKACAALIAFAALLYVGSTQALAQATCSAWRVSLGLSVFSIPYTAEPLDAPLVTPEGSQYGGPWMHDVVPCNGEPTRLSALSAASEVKKPYRDKAIRGEIPGKFLILFPALAPGDIRLGVNQFRADTSRVTTPCSKGFDTGFFREPGQLGEVYGCVKTSGRKHLWRCIIPEIGPSAGACYSSDNYGALTIIYEREIRRLAPTKGAELDDRFIEFLNGLIVEGPKLPD